MAPRNKTRLRISAGAFTAGAFGKAAISASAFPVGSLSDSKVEKMLKFKF